MLSINPFDKVTCEWSHDLALRARDSMFAQQYMFQVLIIIFPHGLIDWTSTVISTFRVKNLGSSLNLRTWSGLVWSSGDKRSGYKHDISR